MSDDPTGLSEDTPEAENDGNTEEAVPQPEVPEHEEAREDLRTEVPDQAPAPEVVPDQPVPEDEQVEVTPVPPSAE